MIEFNVYPLIIYFGHKGLLLSIDSLQEGRPSIFSLVVQMEVLSSIGFWVCQCAKYTLNSSKC